MISLRAFFKSFHHALRGLAELFKTEQSFRLQVLATIIVGGLLIGLDLAAWQRILLILLCSAVLILEIINSIIERVADAVQPRLSPMVKDVKDMMAGAVLLTALTALVVGTAILYLPVWEKVCAIIQYCKP
ncbi:MAG: diacylglycerol kinase family protein [Patescibacteria group bacterium]|jgi:diacylglycerol kinase